MSTNEGRDYVIIRRGMVLSTHMLSREDAQRTLDHLKCHGMDGLRLATVVPLTPEGG